MWRLTKAVVFQTRWHCRQKLPSAAAQSTLCYVDTSRMFSSTNLKKHFSPNLKIIQPQRVGTWEDGDLWETRVFRWKIKFFPDLFCLVENPVWHQKEVLTENFLPAAPQSCCKKLVVPVNRCKSRKQEWGDNNLWTLCVVLPNLCASPSPA